MGSRVWMVIGLSLGSCAAPPQTDRAPVVTPTNTIAPSVSVGSPPPVTPPTYGKASAQGLTDGHTWPPPRVTVDAPKPEPAEGEWVPYERPWMHTLEGAPTTFYTTHVRPDPKRGARAQFVAMDARQLEFDMAIGVEGPFPPDEKTAGKWPRFGGKLPREAPLAKRVVAAFNGGFRFDQGKWGMTIRRREWNPPVPDVASLLMFDDGRLGFGTWGPAMQTPSEVRSLRQNLDPLVDDGLVNPRKRPKWGGILAVGGKQVGQRAKRSGICRTKGGHFLYAWGNDLEAEDLGAAMTKAGCDYGMHLDMNLYHVGFVFMSYEDAGYAKGKAEALSPTMGVGNTRYVHQPSPKEFFYAALRPPPTMAADGGTQPPPTWQPAIRAKEDAGVRLTVFDSKKVRLAVVFGHEEPTEKGPLYLSHAPPPLGADDATKVLASIRLGVAKTKMGLVLGGQAKVSDAGGLTRVSVDRTGRLFLADPGTSGTSASELFEAPAAIVDGKATALDEGTFDVVVGVNERGDLLVAERVGKTGALIATLLAAGVKHAIAPRGGLGKLERMGRDAIATGGADTRLYVLGLDGAAATFRFDLDAAGAPRWPKIDKPVK